MKRIIISESQLKKIVDHQIDEQSLPKAQLTQTPAIKTDALKPTMNIQSGTYTTTTKAFDKGFDDLCKILSNARNVSWADGIKKTLTSSESDIENFAESIILWTKRNKYNPKLLKAAITVIFRESKASSYSFLNPKEWIGKIENAVGMPDIKVFGKNIGGSNHSQGYAQIQPSTAKQYGIDMSTQGTFIGALDGAYKILNSNYQKSLKFYKGQNIIFFQDNKYLQTPGLDNDAALYMAVAAHNAGSGIINSYCQTNVVGLANPCNVKSRTLENQNLITNPNKPINNYFPNVGGVHKYMPQFKKCFDALASVPNALTYANIPTNPPNRFD
jgi:hypothetical protein